MYKTDLECKVCGEVITTGWCKTKFGRWIKTQIAKKNHQHTNADVIYKEDNGMYYSTTENHK